MLRTVLTYLKSWLFNYSASHTIVIKDYRLGFMQTSFTFAGVYVPEFAARHVSIYSHLFRSVSLRISLSDSV